MSSGSSRRPGRPLTAADGPSALAVLKADPKVRLLFSDVVMPGMSGVELAREAQALRPDLKVLLSTGYASNKLKSAELTRVMRQALA